MYISSFTESAALERHQVTHSDDKPFPCTTCGKGFKRKEDYNRHIRIGHLEKDDTHTAPPVKIKPEADCDLFEFKKPKVTNKGTRAKKKHICPHCGKECLTPSLLRRHVNNAHDKIQPFQCEICQKKFTQKCNLTTHMSYHLGKKDCICEICGKSYYRTSKLFYLLTDYRYLLVSCGISFSLNLKIK